MGQFFRNLMGSTSRKHWPLQITYTPTASSSEEVLVEKKRMINAVNNMKTEMVHRKQIGAAPVIISKVISVEGDPPWNEGLDDPNRPLVLNLDLDLKISKNAKISSIRGIEKGVLREIDNEAVSNEDGVPGFKSDQLSVIVKNPEPSHETDLTITYDMSPFPHHLKEKSLELQDGIYRAIGRLGATEAHDDHVLKESLRGISDPEAEQAEQFSWTVRLKDSNQPGSLIDRATEIIKGEVRKSLKGRHVDGLQIEATTVSNGLGSDSPPPPPM